MEFIISTDEIEELIKDNISTYKQHRRIISDFRLEKGTTESYNGRQILELIQNADDAKTDIVEININREDNILSIYNNGTPFDMNGVGSLLIANTSSKNKEFIGNKGLGFRSVLNWVSEIRIKTRHEILLFSKALAIKNFNKLVPDIFEQKRLIEENTKYLIKGEVPFAVLAIPEVSNNVEQQSYDTCIELKYLADKEDDILEQLKCLSPEILLFLNNCEEIIIKDSYNVLDKSIKRDIESTEEIVSINNTTWLLEDSGNVFYCKGDKQDKFYRFRIAWQKDLSDKNSKFFSFFPTQVSTHLPFLIHATFDLDPTRNHLNNSIENKDLLNAITKTIGNIALDKIRRKDKADWNAYKFLSIKGKSDNKLLFDFFQNISNSKKILPIYPCVDGEYREIGQLKFYGNDFSDWVLRNNMSELFPDLLLPIGEEIDFQRQVLYYNSKYPLDFWNTVFLKSECPEFSIEERVALMKIFLSSDFESIHNKVKMPLLLDYKGEVVEGEKLVVTVQEDSVDKYRIPNEIKISFLNKELSILIRNKFSHELKLARNENETTDFRALKRVLSKIVNIGSNDITEVIRVVISETNSIITNIEDSKAIVYINKMLSSLFLIYKKNPENKTKLNYNIPVINRLGEIINSSDLFLGNEYSSGLLTEEIFEGIYTNSQYLFDFSSTLLVESNEDLELLESFFLWLGVNRILKYETKIRENVLCSEYIEYVSSKINMPDKITYLWFSGISISNIKDVRQLSINKLLILLCQEIMIFNRLDYNNNDKLSHKYGNTYERFFNQKPSYIEYQLSTIFDFNEYIVNTDDIALVGNKVLDINIDVFKKYKVEDKILYVLKKLGVKSSFNDFTPNDIYELLRNYPTNENTGNDSQSFYKRILDYFVKDRDFKLQGFKPDLDGISYYSRKGGIGNDYILKDVSELYYSDNKLLPQKLLNSYWMINLPMRRGEQNIAKYFGVKLIKDELRKLSIVASSLIIHPLNNTFIKYIEDIKPFLLTHRFDGIKSGQKEKEAHRLKSLNICLVEKCEYSFGERKEELDNNDFIILDDVCYIKYNSNLIDINGLKSDSNFCDSIAEIICICFKINKNNNIFRSVFKDSVMETLHIIEKEELKYYLTEAYKFLGVSRAEYAFWKRIFRLKNIVFPDSLIDSKELSHLLESEFDIDTVEQFSNVDFINFLSRESFVFLKYITEKLQINLIDTLGCGSSALKAFYENALVNYMNDIKTHYINSLWSKLSKDKDKQSNYIDLKIDFNNTLLDNEFIEIIKNNKFNLYWDYETSFNEYISRKYDLIIDFDLKVDESIKYLDLLKGNNIACDDLDVKIHSLLFFDGNEDEISKLIQRDNPSEINKNADAKEDLTGDIEYVNSTKVKELPKKMYKVSSYTHSKKEDNRKVLSGRISEEIVYNSLIRKYGEDNVQWVSGFSKTKHRIGDSLHYDLKYKNGLSSDWKLLEVKSYNGNYFHLSRDEMEIGKRNLNNYEIALVFSDRRICIINDFFIYSESETFEKNKKYSVISSDYIIGIEVE